MGFFYWFFLMRTNSEILFDKRLLRYVQTALIADGGNPGPIDGVYGGQTYQALKHVDEVPRAWTGARLVVAYLQVLGQRAGLVVGEVDGYWGPQTDYVFQCLMSLEATGVLPVDDRIDERRVTSADPDNPWPRSDQKSLQNFYGKPGSGLQTVPLPVVDGVQYPMRLAWGDQPVVTKITCHNKVADSLVRVLTNVLKHYGPQEIEKLHLDQYGGCFNIRNKKFGETLSTHAYGAAVDFAPQFNRYSWKRDRALFAGPEYDYWWKCWEDEWWVSLGRLKGFGKDWMHIQAVQS